MSEVRAYYDSNTWWFLLFGSEQAIHRELWAPAVTSKRQAMHYAHELVLDELVELGEGGRRALDLGCGVGAACRFLAQRTTAALHGVTISPRQVALARRFAARAGLAGRCGFTEADFCELPGSLGDFDLCFAIEAFIHASSADRFLAAAAAALRPGGRLIVIDDFLTSVAEHPQLVTARSGWHMDSLCEVGRAVALAAGHGLELVASRDLSPYQNLGRLRDRLVRRLMPIIRPAARHSLWCQSLVGGDALQACHQLGLLEYRMLSFVRR